MDNRHRLLTRREVANRLGVSYPAVAKWHTLGELPVVVVGRQKMVPEEALTPEFVAKHGKARPPEDDVLLAVSMPDLLAELSTALPKIIRKATRGRFIAVG